MKINKFLTFVGLTAVLFWSCEDATDIIQDGELNPEAIYETVDDMQLSLTGVYANYNAQNEIRFTAPFTDEIARGSDNGGQQRDLYVNILDATSGSAVSLWASNYNVANEATRLIEGARLVERTMDNGETYDRILAQAYALRALAHFNLIKYFSVDITDNSSSGVPNLDFVPVPTGAYPRNATGENLTLIQNDLNEATTLIGDADLGVTFIDTDVINAIRARVALYTEDYSTAENLADQLIANYALADQGEYQDLHEDIYNNGVEVIWSYDYTQSAGQGGSIGNLYNNVSSDIGGAPILEMGRNVYNKLEDADIRKTQFVDGTSIIDANYTTAGDPLNSDVLVVNKYPGSGGFLLVNDIKLFRVSEMYFIKAEARINAGDLSGAADALVAVKRARYADNTIAADSYSNATEAWAAVLEARQLELWGEGHRYLDLKRLSDKAGVTELERDLVDCNLFNVGAASCNLATSNFKFQTLPIPIAELNGNTGIGPADQNPGY